MKRLLTKSIAILLLACFVTTAANAQVTIGVGEKPAKGALLDLKDHNPDPLGTDKTTATKGLLLPRVGLTELNKLYPMLPTGYNTAVEDELHIGLNVYNVNRCPAGSSIYDETGPQVWSGTRWESLKLRPAIAEANPAQTSGANVWGASIVHHAAKPNPSYIAGTDPAYLANIYEEFYSADFGSTAGRWMTTNLTAYKYDGLVDHSQGYLLRLEVSDASAPNPIREPYWCYPGSPIYSGGGGLNDATHTGNPLLGLLYNWSAATAGKGGQYGDDSDIDESAMDETLTNEPGKQQRIQGICPEGWHLPSDLEWTELENEIIRHTTRYAAVSENIDSGDGSKLLLPNATNSRGTHNQAMKSPCVLLSLDFDPLYFDPNGLSKSLSQNGFNVLMAGTPNSFGTSAYLWCSSSNTKSGSGAVVLTGAWVRSLQYSTIAGYSDGVQKESQQRHEQKSVRCKKD
jgi:hypothetical protein